MIYSLRKLAVHYDTKALCQLREDATHGKLSEWLNSNWKIPTSPKRTIE
jgi:hypothetical protein